MFPRCLIKPRFEIAKGWWKGRVGLREPQPVELEAPWVSSFLSLTFEKETCFPHAETPECWGLRGVGRVARTGGGGERAPYDGSVCCVLRRRTSLPPLTAGTRRHSSAYGRSTFPVRSETATPSLGSWNSTFTSILPSIC